MSSPFNSEPKNGDFAAYLETMQKQAEDKLRRDNARDKVMESEKLRNARTGTAASAEDRSVLHDMAEKIRRAKEAEAAARQGLPEGTLNKLPENRPAARTPSSVNPTTPRSERRNGSVSEEFRTRPAQTSAPSYPQPAQPTQGTVQPQTRTPLPPLPKMPGNERRPSPFKMFAGAAIMLFSITAIISAAESGNDEMVPFCMFALMAGFILLGKGKMGK